jgi:hypothetical protein
VWVERIEADVRAAQQAALTAYMFGGKPEWPSLDDRLAELDAALVAEPQRSDTPELELRDALGLRRPHG